MLGTMSGEHETRTFLVIPLLIALGFGQPAYRIPLMTNEQPPASEAQEKKAWSPTLMARGFDQLKAADYIEERINPEIEYYNKQAGKAKRNYLTMRGITVVGGALVPVLININGLPLPYSTILTTATTVISLMVVLFVSLETVYRYREQWTNYRTAEHKLKNEYFLFTSKAGEYAELDEHRAYIIFVNRIEQALETENASTLNVMTSLTEPKAMEQSREIPNQPEPDIRQGFH